MNRYPMNRTPAWAWVLTVLFTLGAVLALVMLLWLASPAAYGQYTNVGPSARSNAPTVTNYVSQFWVTNGAGGGVYTYSAGLSSSNMLTWTNISVVGGLLTNYYLIFNDITWRTNTASPTWYKADVYDCGTNWPDVGPSVPVNTFATTNNQFNGQWWQNTSSKPWPASPFTVTATGWNTTQGWNAPKGPVANTNINYSY